MRALSQDEMKQVSGGWFSWGWSSWSFKSYSYSYCKPKTTYTCQPKTTDSCYTQTKDSCYTNTSCEPKPTCPVEEIPL